MAMLLTAVIELSSSQKALQQSSHPPPPTVKLSCDLYHVPVFMGALENPEYQPNR
jgi:hypothetical protein